MSAKSFLDPIGNNKSIVDTVVERITDGIIRGQIKPGQKIPTELELSESLGVGRNSIREAIKILTALGILEIRRADGTYVSSQFSEKMINPLIYCLILEKDSSLIIEEFRSMLEVGSIELAIEKATEDDKKRLREMIAGLISEISKEKPDYKKITEIDMDFHQEIVKITQNPLIIKVGEIISRLTKQSQLKTVRALLEESNTEYLIGVHEEIAQLIENKDYENIRSVIKRSHSYWRNNIENF